MEGDLSSPRCFEGPLLGPSDFRLPRAVSLCSRPGESGARTVQHSSQTLLWAAAGPGTGQHQQPKAGLVPGTAQPFAARPGREGCALVTGCGAAGTMADTSDGRHAGSTERSACWVAEMGDNTLEESPPPCCLFRAGSALPSLPCSIRADGAGGGKQRTLLRAH